VVVCKYSDDGVEEGMLSCRVRVEAVELTGQRRLWRGHTSVVESSTERFTRGHGDDLEAGIEFLVD
jgi:hypothetical protein